MTDAAEDDRSSSINGGEASAADKTPAPPGALHIRCPHCLSRSAVADDAPLEAFVCPSCGTKFALAGEETAHGAFAEDTGAAGGKMLSHFQLLERLGAGGFGTVWKARDVQLDRIVAVKIPHRGRLGGAEGEKVLREARAAAQLRHPNIVSVHEVGLGGDLVYIVSDFVEGQPLDQWLAVHEPGHREAAALAAKIAAALDHAHEEGVVHRDLKPNNIMVDLAGEPHLMDFGLAKREAGETTMTLDGQILGTPAYMSPEQAAGHAHTADRRTDVYSLGVILFELLTGERPFRGSMQMLIRQVIEDEPPSPRKLDGRIPRDLETICLKCVQKEPRRRYATANAVAEELGRFLAGLPIEARPVGAVERLARWCRRNPLVAALSAIAICGLLLGLVGVSIGYLRASRDRARAEASLLQARKAVDDLFTRVSEDTLLNQPGMQPLRSDLLRRARDYYEKLLAQSEGAEPLRDDLALAHFRVGLITEEIESPGKALPSYEKARDLQTELLAAAPDDADRLRALGDTLNALGRCLYNQQRLDQASAAYAAAVEVRSRLAQAAPQQGEFRRALANTVMNIGLVEKERNPDQARQSLEKAQAIRQALLADGSQDVKLQRDLAMGDFNLAVLAEATRRIDDAEALLEKSTSRFAALSQREPGDLGAAYQLAVCYRKQADVACSRKKRDAAIRLYAQARDVMAALAEKNPSVVEYQVALAEIHINIAQAEHEQGQQDAALKSFERAYALLAPLRANHADNARYRRNLIVTLGAMAKLHPDPRQRPQAEQALESLHRQLQQMDDAGARQHLEMIGAALRELKPVAAKPPPER